MKYNAEPGAVCKGDRYQLGCATGRDAVHTIKGRHFCAYHSPYDIECGNGFCAGRHSGEDCPVLENEREWTPEACQDTTCAEHSKPLRREEPPMAKEYRQYISDGLADTDGYFAPIPYEVWIKYHIKQARHGLCPCGDSAFGLGLCMDHWQERRKLLRKQRGGTIIR